MLLFVQMDNTICNRLTVCDYSQDLPPLQVLIHLCIVSVPCVAASVTFTLLTIVTLVHHALNLSCLPLPPAKSHPRSLCAIFGKLPTLFLVQNNIGKVSHFASFQWLYCLASSPLPPAPPAGCSEELLS